MGWTATSSGRHTIHGRIHIQLCVCHQSAYLGASTYRTCGALTCCGWVDGVLLSHSACADAKVNNKAGSGGGAAIMQCFSPDHVPVMYVFRALLAFSRANSVCVCDNVRPCRAHVLRDDVV